MLSGDLDAAQTANNTGLMVYDAQSNTKVGETITLNANGSTEDIEIVGILSECPFNNRSDVDKLICSETTFKRLTGETDYTIIDIQLLRNATEKDVNEIRGLVGVEYTFSDKRIGNSNAKGVYYSFGLFVYGFFWTFCLWILIADCVNNNI